MSKAGVSDEQMARLHGPIGLPIEAQTPEEIAVAILGEMIRAKNGAEAPPAAREPARAVAVAR